MNLLKLILIAFLGRPEKQMSSRKEQTQRNIADNVRRQSRGNV